MLALEVVVTHFARRIRSERGASLVEYALLLALIAMACMAAVTSLGSATSDSLNSAAASL